MGAPGRFTGVSFGSMGRFPPLKGGPAGPATFGNAARSPRGGREGVFGMCDAPVLNVNHGQPHRAGPQIPRTGQAAMSIVRALLCSVWPVGRAPLGGGSDIPLGSDGLVHVRALLCSVGNLTSGPLRVNRPGRHDPR